MFLKVSDGDVPVSVSQSWSCCCKMEMLLWLSDGDVPVSVSQSWSCCCKMEMLLWLSDGDVLVAVRRSCPCSCQMETWQCSCSWREILQDWPFSNINCNSHASHYSHSGSYAVHFVLCNKRQLEFELFLPFSKNLQQIYWCQRTQHQCSKIYNSVCQLLTGTETQPSKPRIQHPWNHQTLRHWTRTQHANYTERNPEQDRPQGR